MAGKKRLAELTDGKHTVYTAPRHLPELLRVFEELGDDAAGTCCELMVSVVSGKYMIEEYDGAETVLEEDDLVWICPA